MRNKYVKVMFGNKGANFEYKIWEINIATVWNPTEERGRDFGGFNYANEDCILRWLHRGDTIYDVIVPEDAEVIPFSSQTGEGVEDLWEIINQFVDFVNGNPVEGLSEEETPETQEIE